jgi:hypothetical protein
MHLIKPTWLTHGGPYDKLDSHKHPSKTPTVHLGSKLTMLRRREKGL